MMSSLWRKDGYLVEGRDGPEDRWRDHVRMPAGSTSFRHGRSSLSFLTLR